MSASQNRKDNHWLVRPKTIRWLWIVSSVILALTVLAQLFVKSDAHFGIDGWLGFAAGFGFLACAVMVFGAKILGMVLKRRDNYYDV